MPTDEEHQAIRDEDPPGLNPRQLEIMVDRVNRVYDQTDPDGLNVLVKEAQERVAGDVGLLKDEKKQERFLKQSSAKAASILCTTISRLAYLEALQMLRPDLIQGDLPSFAEYYITAVRDDAVVFSNVSHTYCLVADERKLIEPYTTTYDYWEIRRGGDYPRDMDLINELRRRKFGLALFRDGPDGDRNTHTLLTALCEDGHYRMLDVYFSRHSGQALPYNRFGPGNPRWLHIVYNYHDVS